MDPTFILATRPRAADKPSAKDVQHFYDAHGHGWLARLSNLRARLRRRSERRQTFAPAIRHG